MWEPQTGPQTTAILTAELIDELLFGGARGGGKSDYLLGDFGQDVGIGLGDKWRGILFRKTYPELEELIFRSQQIYPAWFQGAEYKEAPKTWHFPGGETLRMRYMERGSDADRYQGHGYTWIGFDELGNWATPGGYKKLIGTLRSATPLPGLRIRCSANPGGPGHLWVKQYFGIDRHPNGMEEMTDPVTGMKRLFIKSRVQDNKILMEADPNYINRLKGTGSEELVRAWLDGDWDVVLGAFFDCWRSDRHVIKPFEIPEWWTHFRSMDWGSARPFSVGWWAVATDPRETPNGIIPRGALVRYREWYGCIQPNVGLKLTAEQVAVGIRERTPEEETINYTVADPSMWAQDGGPSIAERMMQAGVKAMRRADNKRIAKMGALGGWDQMRRRMQGEDDRPMIYCFDTCTDSIRTIPVLQHDEVNAEDLDTDGEDHAADEWRYACMSRPYTQPKPKAARPVTDRPTFDELMKRHIRRKRSEMDEAF